jgi:hypothetical protein
LQLLLLIVIVVAAAVVFWPRPEFVIGLDGGEVEVRRGKVPRGFLDDCRKLSAECGIRGGQLSGSRGLGGIELRFSSNIDTVDQQRFRNVWSLHG